jgi:hypothetical protein
MRLGDRLQFGAGGKPAGGFMIFLCSAIFLLHRTKNDGIRVLLLA